MKSFLLIILIMLVLIIGINIGSGSDISKSEIIKDKIEDFENGIINNDNTISHNIEPNLLNKLAEKCNDTLDNIIEKVLKQIVS